MLENIKFYYPNWRMIYVVKISSDKNATRNALCPECENPVFYLFMKMSLNVNLLLFANLSRPPGFNPWFDFKNPWYEFSPFSSVLMNFQDLGLFANWHHSRIIRTGADTNNNPSTHRWFWTTPDIVPAFRTWSPDGLIFFEPKIFGSGACRTQRHWCNDLYRWTIISCIF